MTRRQVCLGYKAGVNAPFICTRFNVNCVVLFTARVEERHAQLCFCESWIGWGSAETFPQLELWFQYRWKLKLVMIIHNWFLLEKETWVFITLLQTHRGCAWLLYKTEIVTCWYLINFSKWGLGQFLLVGCLLLSVCVSALMIFGPNPLVRLVN